MTSLYELGITPQKVAQFSQKHIETAENLVEFFPRKYFDCRQLTDIRPSDQLSVLAVTPLNVTVLDNRVPMLKVSCHINGTKKCITIIWFGSTYLVDSIRTLIHQTVYVAGYANYQYGLNISNPIFFTPDKKALRILPVYSKIAGMSNDYLTAKIDLALRLKYPEPYPIDFGAFFNQITYNESLHEFHHPSSYTNLQKAIKRRNFDSLLRFALRMEQQNREMNLDSPFVFKTAHTAEQIIASLPYTLTADQCESIEGIVNECMSGRRLNALVQGDVGCGKTIISFLAMFVAAENGYQAAMMAPTQVLAKQHFADIQQYAMLTGIKVACLTSDMTPKQQRLIIEQIRTGEVSIVLGTSSIIGKSVEYKNLALTVVDEEHKFGVVQKRALNERAKEGVHSIIMSATPIPRSLASIVHGGNMELFTIKTMPRGRQPVRTFVCENKDVALPALIEELKKGRQAYIVCPAIDKNEDMEGVEAVEDVFGFYEKHLASLDYNVAILTGRTKKKDLAAIIDAFQNNEIQVLIATTVIEVGVNVPNASVMVVHNAERFGLSSLHQLRGRVGRGTHPSICLLISNRDCKRLNVMCETTDGFKVAEADLKQRGAGELFGVKQSGMDKYTELILLYPDLYADACQAAKYILDENIECAFLNEWVDEEESDELIW